MKTFIGIDYSMTSPAICGFIGNPKEFSYESCVFYSLSDFKLEECKLTSKCKGSLKFETHKDYNSQTERFHNISKWAMDSISWISSPKDCLVCIEDYSMGSKGKTFNIGENTGILQYKLWMNNIPYIKVPPTVVKKIATGKGNAKKEAMAEQFEKDTGVNLKEKLQPKRLLGSPTTDIIDAYYITKYAISL